MNERQQDDLVNAICRVAAAVAGTSCCESLQSARGRLADALDACFRDGAKQDDRTVFNDIKVGQRFRWFNDDLGSVYIRIPGVTDANKFVNAVIIASHGEEELGCLCYFPDNATVYPVE